MTVKRALVAISLPIWIGSVTVGFLSLWHHSGVPGTAASPPERWPAESRIPHAPGLEPLVLFAHPHCPCTRASLSELALVLATTSVPVQAWVLIVKPEGVEAGWEKGGNYELAQTISQARVMVDDRGSEARRFGARTSGQVLYYDGGGRLRFHGGITAGRGHQGDSAGKESLLALL